MLKRKRDTGRTYRSGNEKKCIVEKGNKGCQRSNKEIIIVKKNSTKIEELDSGSLSFVKDQDLHNFPVSPVQPAEQVKKRLACALTH